jgi:hypothetical protein
VGDEEAMSTSDDTPIAPTMPSKWRPFKIGAGVGLGALVLFGYYQFTMYEGRSALIDLAREKNLCSDDRCDDGLKIVEDLMQKEKGISPGLLEWCVGVDDWADTRVARGGAIKDIMVWAMYLPCGALTPEPVPPKVS